jgi:sec-independent protein translocase protein TatC
MTTAKPETADTHEMPFLDHLEELRWRLFKVLIALVGGFVLGFGLLSTKSIDLLNYLQRPLQATIPDQLVYTSPTDPFNVVISASLGLGFLLALPVICYQIWAFMSPALYQNERRVVIPVMFGATLLFSCGVALAFYFVLPVTLGFLVSFQTQAFRPMIEVREYFSFVFGMCLAFGAAFELPIVILALTAFGLVTPPLLMKFRRHAFVGCLALAAIITPGDAVTALVMMTIPLYFLYEGGIILSRIVYRRKLRAQEIGSEAIA